MINITFAGLITDKNLGDNIIFNCTKNLYVDEFKKNNINIIKNYIDLKEKTEEENLVYRIIKKILKYNKKMLFKFMSYRLKKQYLKHINNSDLIVVVGGGIIKYKYQRFFLYLDALISVAAEKKIPVIINAAGVEGYNQNDIRCQILKKALNNKHVIAITTRDDIQTLTQNYITDTSKYIAKTADSAINCDYIYNKEKQNSEVYGIGLIRENIFTDNEIPFDAQNLANLYSELITELESMNLKYQLFTNGLPADTDIVLKIKKNLGRADINVTIPNDDEDLLNIISSFKTIVAARLHANIIAFSLNVPTIGLVWNNKLTMFGNDINHPERFIKYSDFSAKKILDAATLASKEGYNEKAHKYYKDLARIHINEIVNKYLSSKK